MKYTIEYVGLKGIAIKVETESIADIEEAHNKVKDELKWLVRIRDELEPYEP